MSREERRANISSGGNHVPRTNRDLLSEEPLFQSAGSSRRDSGLPDRQVSGRPSLVSGAGPGLNEFMQQVLDGISEIERTSRAMQSNFNSHVSSCLSQFHANNTLIKCLQNDIRNLEGGGTVGNPFGDSFGGLQRPGAAVGSAHSGLGNPFWSSMGPGGSDPPLPPGGRAMTGLSGPLDTGHLLQQPLINALIRSSMFNQLPIPTFPQSEHPLMFLRKLEDYFGAFPHFSIQDKLLIIDQALKEDAALWFRPRRQSYTTYEEFKRDFEDEFWGTGVQADLIGSLYNGRYRTGSMETYARRWQGDLSFLTYPIPEPVVVGILIRHFDQRIQKDLMLFEVNSFQTLFAKLRVLDRTNRSLRTDAEPSKR
ncbi:unnamed protein product, partial [Nesidiocoris tenuis]